MSEEQVRINLEHKLEVAQAEVRVLQERVAFAEQARDNACAQRDAAMARSNNKGVVPGRIIGELVALVKRIVQNQPALAAQWGLEEQLTVILNKQGTPP